MLVTGSQAAREGGKSPATSYFRYVSEFQNQEGASCRMAAVLSYSCSPLARSDL